MKVQNILFKSTKYRAKVQKKIHICKFLAKKFVHHTLPHYAHFHSKPHQIPHFIGNFIKINHNTNAYYFA